MAQTIKIRRSTTTASPLSLQNGEMAYSAASNKLYIGRPGGTTGDIDAIGGKAYTDKLDAATALNNVNTLVLRDGSGNFSAGTITAALSGNATTASSWATARTISLSGDVTGSVSIDGSSNVTINTTVEANSVALGTDTTGNYVATIAPTVTNNLVVANSGTESAAVTLDLSATGVAANTYGSTSAIPVISVDSKGRITSASTASISTSFTISADSGTNDVVNGGETLTISGTTGEIDTAVTNNQITVGLAANPNVSGNLTVGGDLTVNGTMTTVNSTTLEVTDPLISLAAGNAATDSVDIGFYGLYDTSGTQDLYAGLFRDATDGYFRLFQDLQVEPGTTVDTGGLGYAIGTMVANLRGGTVSNLTSSIAVSDGGTGLSSYAAGDIVYASGATTLNKLGIGTADQLLTVSGGVPSWTSTLDGGTF